MARAQPDHVPPNPGFVETPLQSLMLQQLGWQMEPKFFHWQLTFQVFH